VVDIRIKFRKGKSVKSSQVEGLSTKSECRLRRGMERERR